MVGDTWESLPSDVGGAVEDISHIVEQTMPHVQEPWKAVTDIYSKVVPLSPMVAVKCRN
jgi:hypothetical protein